MDGCIRALAVSRAQAPSLSLLTFTVLLCPEPEELPCWHASADARFQNHRRLRVVSTTITRQCRWLREQSREIGRRQPRRCSGGANRPLCCSSSVAAVLPLSLRGTRLARAAPLLPCLLRGPGHKTRFVGLWSSRKQAGRVSYSPPVPPIVIVSSLFVLFPFFLSFFKPPTKQ